MGGCRCTYRNCMVRSDGKTHLFHYPVFDKVRCNQWLNNAGRFDFLSLKVSQLKNRCICQHHFLDVCFMNNKKDKLKLEAIPTLDGPYCESEKFKTPEVPENPLVLYPIASEDIENDEYISDRKANYNLKYADFLTNSEALFYPLKHESNIEMTKSPVIASKDSQPVPKAILVHTAAKSHITKKGKVKIISEKKITEPEKKITVPLSTGSFKPVLPSTILNVNRKRTDKVNPRKDIVGVAENQLNNRNERTITEILTSADPSKFEIEIDMQEVVVETPNITFMNKAQPDKEINISNDQVNEKLTEIESSYEQHNNKFKTQECNPLPSKQTPENKVTHVIAKSKISPERLAAINEKRRFNMKLKDIIEAELNKLDNNQGTPKNESKSKKRKILDSKSETVASSISTQPNLADNKDNIIAYLDARMRKMENLLLNKIDQNTQKIMELKRSFDPPEQESKSSQKSTRHKNLHDESHKRHLFKEISQYLTPDANSLIYEELFINKFKPNVSQVDSVPPQKRKRR